METLELKAPTYGIGGNRMYSDVHSGIGSRAIIYMQNYNLTWNEINNSYINTIPYNTSEDTDPQETIPQETISQDTVPHETIQQTEFPSDDIRLVAQQAGVGVTRALEALRTTNGDIVNSILHLIQEI
jgi:NACalpha-BTF3-like transcription factor